MSARDMLLLIACAGCRQLAGLDDPLPADGGDACFGTGEWTICLASPPNAAVALPATLETTGVARSPLCLPASAWSWRNSTTQPDACVIAAPSLDVASAVRATGMLPIVLLASDSLTLGSALDVASRTDGGAGAGLGACAGFALAPEEHTQGGGGGAGGSFGSQGGAGGAGNGGNAAAGTPGPTNAASELRGGCSGQDGARGSGGGSIGAGGLGGGAVYLAANGEILITATGSINASGAGGEGGGDFGGAGGGGSGGMIVLFAPEITASGGVLVANGGGGGSGGSGSANGASGGVAAVAAPTTPASGGGGTGGAGFAGTMPATAGLPADSNVGGSGGGGGGGVIRANHGIEGATSSPTIVPL